MYKFKPQMQEMYENVNVQGSLYVSVCCSSGHGCAPGVQGLSSLLIIKLRKIYDSSFAYRKKKNKKNNLQTNKKQQREIRFHLKHDKIC